MRVYELIAAQIAYLQQVVKQQIYRYRQVGAVVKATFCRIYALDTANRSVYCVV